MEFLSEIPLIGPVLFWVLPFIVVLSVVVFIHELGHLMVGRWCGIKAEVFSIGFGKVLFSRTDRQGTKWQIALLPLGGFVKFLGDMDPASAGKADESEVPEDQRKYAFHNASVGRRSLTVAAGPVANFLFSIVLFFCIALYIGKASNEPVIASIGELDVEEIGFQPGDRVLRIGDREIENFGHIVDALAASEGEPLQATVLRDGAELTIQTSYSRRPRVTGMEASGAALAAGMRPGDILLSVGGTEVHSSADVSLAVAELPPGEEIVVQVERDGQVRNIAIVPDLRLREHPGTKEEQELPFLGISMARVQGIEPTAEPASRSEAASYGVRQVWRIISDTITYIGRMIFDGADTSHLSGPIGIAKHSTGAAEQGLVYYILFIAFVSTAIGLLNLFPIPVLDGGHLVFYAIEAVRRRPTNETVVRYGTIAGLSLLLLLMVFVTFINDLGLGALLSQH